MSKVIVEKLSEDEINKRGIRNWPIWEKEISRFPWTYEDEEECLIIEGEFQLECDEGIFIVKSGDFVTFKIGLECIWEIKKPIKKHYNFK